MFTWICPRCGREVPPAYDECPDCARAQAAAPAEAPAPPEPAQPIAPPPAFSAPPPLPAGGAAQAAPSPAYDAPPYATPQYPAPQYTAPPYAAPAAPRGPLPTWLLTLVFALAFVGLVGGGYLLAGYLKGSGSGASSKQLASVESTAARPGASPSPYQKYIEISGIRILENAKKKPEVHFVVTNHSGAAIDGLSGNVTIWGRTQKSEEEAAGTFQFTTNIGAYETRDLTVPLSTKLRTIELPDWQNTTADVQITAPH
jgi:hypothetical protein